MLPVSGAEQLNTSDAQPSSPHLLGAQRIFEVGELGAFELEAVIDMRLARMRGHEEIPQALHLRLGLHLLDHRVDRPAVAFVRGRAIVAVARADGAYR